MKEKILIQLIELRNLVHDFCAKLTATLLQPLKNSRYVVNALLSKNQQLIENLSKAHNILIENMCDIDIAHMNKDGGQAQDATGMKRILQGRLTPAIDQIKRDFQDDKGMQNGVNIIQFFMYVNLDYILDQLLASSFTQDAPIIFLLDNFLLGLENCQHILQEHPPISCHKAELIAIRTQVELIQRQLTGQPDLYLDLLEILQKQYELNRTRENNAVLIAQYRKENIERQFGRVQDLQRECNALQQRIHELQAQDRSFNAVAATKGMYAVPPTTKSQEEITRLQPLLVMRQGILTQFMDIIKLRTQPFDLTSGAGNESYDPNAAYCYAVILLCNKQPDRAAVYLAMYLRNHPTRLDYQLKAAASPAAGPTAATRLDYQLKAYCLLYIILTNYPIDKGQETTLQGYVDSALALENVLESPDNFTLGIGHYLQVLHNVSLITQLPEQGNAEKMPLIRAITEHCFKAANKNFDFESLVNPIMSHYDTRREASKVLFDAKMVNDLRNKPPESSIEYAKMFLALICQDLGQGGLAREHLLQINLASIVNKSHREIITYAQSRIRERNDHDISVALVNGVCVQVQGAVKGPEGIYQKSTFDAIFLNCIQGIYEAKQQNKDPIDFLTICHLYLGLLLQHPDIQTCDQPLLKATIQQLIAIIDREYLIFSADPEKLANAALRDLANKFAELPIAGDCIRELRKQAKYFGGVMAHQCETIVQAELKAQASTTATLAAHT